MHNICDLSTITWVSPWQRFLWEGICGLGGPFITITIVVVIMIIIFVKISEAANKN